jgi:hypothetical protein
VASKYHKMGMARSAIKLKAMKVVQNTLRCILIF